MSSSNRPYSAAVACQALLKILCSEREDCSLLFAVADKVGFGEVSPDDALDCYYQELAEREPLTEGGCHVLQ